MSQKGKSFTSTIWGRDVHAATTLTETMDAVRASVTGVNSMLTFERFEGLDDVILEATDRAVREAFGKNFLGYMRHDEPGRINILPGWNDSNKIELKLDFSPRYKGKGLFGGDLLADAADSNALRDHIDRVVEEAVQARWPDAKVWLQHSGHRRHWERRGPGGGGYYYSLHLTVQVEPEFKGIKALAA